MRRYLLVCLPFFLGACASNPDIYSKPGGTQASFQQDYGYCKMVGMNAPQYHPAPLPPSYTANTTYTGMGNYGTATTTIQAQDNPMNGLNALVAAIGNAQRQKQATRYCMEAKGYTLRATK